MNSAYENSLKVVIKRFYLAALLLLAVAVACVTQLRARKVTEKMLQGVTVAQGGFTRVMAATANRRKTLSALKAQLVETGNTSSAEMVLYRKFEELKARLGADDMSMGSIEKKGGESTLPFNIIFINTEFNALLNTVSGLHGNSFPLTPVSAVAVTQSDAKGSGAVTYTLTGKIITGDGAKP